MSTRKTSFGLADLERRYGPLTLGRFLSSWRTSESLSQKDFAKKIGISPANLCDIERGRKGVSIFKAAQIAKEIGFSPTMLVQLALQDQMNSSGLDYAVEVKKRVA
ncbi:MAG: helix-turn-helix transcriptional regulator [Deltaproteobacteria bacterium]|nr:helix-turn-helix transcriptional regulator [Deltaproteobacteria bacterium]